MKVAQIDGVFYKVDTRREGDLGSCKVCAFKDKTEAWCNKMTKNLPEEHSCVFKVNRHYIQLEIEDLSEADVDNAPNILTGVNK